MIEKIFVKHDEKSLAFNYHEISKLTSEEFADTVAAKIGEPIGELRAAGDRKTAFLYFRSGRNYFSFAWDKKKKQLLFSEQQKSKWNFVIGYQEI